MTTTSSIENMIAEISNYQGNFGDPIIDHVNFDPLETLLSGNHEIEIGAGIALLVRFVSHVDNATYDAALKGNAASDLRFVINRNICANHSVLFNAFNAVFDSEAALYRALKDVYEMYIFKC